MTTSGTYNSAPVTTVKLIDHAIRRCKINPASLTPEDLTTARESLRFLLLSLASNGLNLWMVNRFLLGLNTNQATYELPEGTLDLLNLTYCHPQLATGTDTDAAQSRITVLDSATTIFRVGVRFDVISPAETITISHSSDGITWIDSLVVPLTDWETDTTYWFNLDPVVNDVQFRVSSLTDPITVNGFYLASTISDIFLSAYNRDDYMNLPNKLTPGTMATNYLFEKLINPQITLWPVPNNSVDHLYGMIHRQVQEVGSLSQELYIPARWQDAVIWKLAEVLAFEFPQVEMPVAASISQMANAAFDLVQKDETDGAPIRVMPNLRGYTR